MANFYMKVGNVARGKNQSAVATVAYITGLEITDTLGEKKDYSHKERVVCFGTELPQSAPEEWKDVEKLWRVVEENEKAKNARFAKRQICSLPEELNEEQLVELVKDYVSEVYTKNNYCVTWAIHENPKNKEIKEGEKKHYHVHIQISDRQFKDGKWQAKEKSQFVYQYEMEEDENGKLVPKLDKLGKKIPLLDEGGKPLRVPVIDKKTGLQKVDSRNRKQWKKENINCNPISEKKFLTNEIRAKWAKKINKHLIQAGREDKSSVTEKSYVDQWEEKGLEPSDAPLPQIKEGYGNNAIYFRRINNFIKELNEKMNANLKFIAELKAKLAKITKKLAELAKNRSETENKASKNAPTSSYFGRESIVNPIKTQHLTEEKNTDTEEKQRKEQEYHERLSAIIAKRNSLRAVREAPRGQQGADGQTGAEERREQEVAKLIARATQSQREARRRQQEAERSQQEAAELIEIAERYKRAEDEKREESERKQRELVEELGRKQRNQKTEGRITSRTKSR